MFDPSQFLQEPPSRPDNLLEALKRLPGIFQKTVKGFGSAFITGYVLASIWGVFRGPLADRGMLWGMDLGCLSAIFAATSEITKNLVGAEPGNAIAVAIRNGLLAVYFKRQATAWAMARAALFYGLLSFYFVSQAQKRQAQMGGGNGMAELLKAMQGMQGGAPGGGAMGGGMDMESFFKAMQVAQSQEDSPFSTGSTSSTTSKRTGKKKSKDAEKKANAVDVEWEPFDDE